MVFVWLEPWMPTVMDFNVRTFQPCWICFGGGCLGNILLQNVNFETWILKLGMGKKGD
jgi:hypothetical protein